MHWRLKAAVQKAISVLPSSMSYATYFWFQRRFGSRSKSNPMSRLAAGLETWKKIEQEGHDPRNRMFFEVGTGRAPIVPLSFWLMGAKGTITVDLNPYLKAQIIKEGLQYIGEHSDDVRELFGPLLNESRLDRLLQFPIYDGFSTEAFLDLCGITYIAPGDAARTGLPPGSIDFHTSYSTFEHIPPDVLRDIVEEGNRIISEGGLFVHGIDYRDHFSLSDKRITSIHFLQHSDAEWEKFAGNKFMYANRLRHDDFLRLFEAAGHRILSTDPEVCERAREALTDGQLVVNERFREKPEETLSIVRSWIVSQPRVHQGAAARSGEHGCRPAARKKSDAIA